MINHRFKLQVYEYTLKCLLGSSKQASWNSIENSLRANLKHGIQHILIILDEILWSCRGAKISPCLKQMNETEIPDLDESVIDEFTIDGKKKKKWNRGMWLLWTTLQNLCPKKYWCVSLQIGNTTMWSGLCCGEASFKNYFSKDVIFQLEMRQQLNWMSMKLNNYTKILFWTDNHCIK